MRTGFQSQIILTIRREKMTYTVLDYLEEGFMALAMMPKTWQ